MPSKLPKVNFVISEEELVLVHQYQKENNIKSLSKAFVELVAKGLANEERRISEELENNKNLPDEVVPVGEYPEHVRGTRFEHSLGTFSAGKSTFINTLIQDPKIRVAAAMDKLNEAGQKKAAERVEELTEVPKYQCQSVPNDDV